MDLLNENTKSSNKRKKISNGTFPDYPFYAGSSFGAREWTEKEKNDLIEFARKHIINGLDSKKKEEKDSTSTK